MAEQKDEITASDYRAACMGIEHCAVALQQCAPDEAILHWLPKLTRDIAVVFSFVGDNATMRHVPKYLETVGALEAAKSVQTSERPGRIAQDDGSSTGGT